MKVKGKELRSKEAKWPNKPARSLATILRGRACECLPRCLQTSDRQEDRVETAHPTDAALAARPYPLTGDAQDRPHQDDVMDDPPRDDEDISASSGMGAGVATGPEYGVVDRGLANMTFEAVDGTVVKIVGKEYRLVLRWTFSRMEETPGPDVLRIMHGAVTRQHPLPVRLADIRKVLGIQDTSVLDGAEGISLDEGGRGLRYDELGRFLRQRFWFLGEDVNLPFTPVMDALAASCGPNALAVPTRLRAIFPEITVDVLSGSLGPADVLDKLMDARKAGACAEDCCIRANLSIGEVCSVCHTPVLSNWSPLVRDVKGKWTCISCIGKQKACNCHAHALHRLLVARVSLASEEGEPRELEAAVSMSDVMRSDGRHLSARDGYECHLSRAVVAPYFRWPCQLIVQPVGRVAMETARSRTCYWTSVGHKLPSSLTAFCTTPDWTVLHSIVADAVKGREGRCDKRQKGGVDLVAFMADTRPSSHPSIRRYWQQFRDAMDAVPDLTCVTLYLCTSVLVNTQMYFHKVFFPWLLSLTFPGAAVMYLDTDAVIASPRRLGALVSLLRAAKTPPAFVCSHDEWSPINGGWIVWPIKQEPLDATSPPPPDRGWEDRDFQNSFRSVLKQMSSPELTVPGDLKSVVVAGSAKRPNRYTSPHRWTRGNTETRKWVERTTMFGATALHGLVIRTPVQAMVAWVLYSAYGLATFKKPRDGNGTTHTKACSPWVTTNLSDAITGLLRHGGSLYEQGQLWHLRSLCTGNATPLVLPACSGFMSHERTGPTDGIVSSIPLLLIDGRPVRSCVMDGNRVRALALGIICLLPCQDDEEAGIGLEFSEVELLPSAGPPTTIPWEDGSVGQILRRAAAAEEKGPVGDGLYRVQAGSFIPLALGAEDNCLSRLITLNPP